MMMCLRMEVSLRDCGRAFDAISDCQMLSAQLEQEASDVWVSGGYDEDDIEMLECDLEDQMLRFGVSEYEIHRIELL